MDRTSTTRAELRTFGFILAGFIGVGLGVLMPWLASRPLPIWPWYIAALVVIWAAVLPGSLALVHRGLLKFGAIMGKITTPVLMTGVFSLTIVPTALVLRLIRRDALNRKLDRNAETYRVVQDPTMEKSLDNPF